MRVLLSYEASTFNKAAIIELRKHGAARGTQGGSCPTQIFCSPSAEKLNNHYFSSYHFTIFILT